MTKQRSFVPKGQSFFCFINQKEEETSMKKILKGTAIFGVAMIALLGLLVALSVWETTGPYNDLEWEE